MYVFGTVSIAERALQRVFSLSVSKRGFASCTTSNEKLILLMNEQIKCLREGQTKQIRQIDKLRNQQRVFMKRQTEQARQIDKLGDQQKVFMERQTEQFDSFLKLQKVRNETLKSQFSDIKTRFSDIKTQFDSFSKWRLETKELLYAGLFKFALTVSAISIASAFGIKTLFSVKQSGQSQVAK